MLKLKPEIRRLFDQVAHEEAILLLVAVGQGLAHLNPLFGGLGRRDLGFLIALHVVEDTEGDRHHVEAIDVAIFAQEIVG